MKLLRYYPKLDFEYGGSAELPRVSVVVCSKKQGDVIPFLDSLEGNCVLTVPELEVVEITGATSMGEGFNLGIVSTKADVLVFTHSDVTVWAGRKMWANMIAEAVKPGRGLVGLAGGTELDETGIWWSEKGTKRGAVAHTHNNQTYVSSFGPFGDVLILDGLLLCASRASLEKIGLWPEDLGFHFYDIEMSIRAHCSGLKNCAVPFPVLHGSIGKVDDAWGVSRGRFLERYREYLDTGVYPSPQR